ncbi:MAG: tRNA (adenosine(37)-N6)-threonylcarbamoyltransferase complex dimerization subunit type 1 TsaB [Deltaproteobacteria bacterium]|jgi:tRNA threonylcarbamoyl adenosine modification protein YeaZ|nr:tRNA (adenosine(37)-N6)-threonylcarbamoyltransferase complex dimerization subunit type 1 TsaB [Deltaproteobacteria bacterium]
MLAISWDTATGALSLALVRLEDVAAAGGAGTGVEAEIFGDTAVAGNAGSPGGAVAPDGDPGILFQAVGEDGGTHSSVLPPLAARALAETGLSPPDLAFVCAGRGPGSFTGLRTGLAFAKGLAMGAGIPAVGVPTLEVLATAVEGPPRLIAPVLDARHSELFTALYLTFGSAARPADAPGGPLAPCGPGRSEARAGPDRRLADVRLPLALTEILTLAPRSFYGAMAERIKSVAGLSPLPPEPLLLTGPGIRLLPDPPEGFAKGPEDGPDAALLARLGQLRLLSEGAAPNPPLPLYGRTPAIFKTWTPPGRLTARNALEGQSGG